MRNLNLLLKKEELIFHHNCLRFIEYFIMFAGIFSLILSAVFLTSII